MAIGVKVGGDQAFGCDLAFDGLVAGISIADQDLLLVLDREPKVFFERWSVLVDGAFRVVRG
jgi:hypothetical protein